MPSWSQSARRSGGNCLLGDLWSCSRGPKDVHQPDLLGHVGERRVGGLAENLAGEWIHGNDPPAVLLHVQQARSAPA